MIAWAASTTFSSYLISLRGISSSYLLNLLTKSSFAACLACSSICLIKIIGFGANISTEQTSDRIKNKMLRPCCMPAEPMIGEMPSGTAPKPRNMSIIVEIMEGAMYSR